MSIMETKKNNVIDMKTRKEYIPTAKEQSKEVSEVKPALEKALGFLKTANEIYQKGYEEGAGETMLNPIVIIPLKDGSFIPRIPMDIPDTIVRSILLQMAVRSGST